MRNIIVLAVVVGLASGLLGTFAFSQLFEEAGAALPLQAQVSTSLSVNRLGGLTEVDRVRTSLKAGEEFWGVAMVENTGADPATFDWTMTLDGTLIAYGGWTTPAGKTALLTSITGQPLSKGRTPSRSRPHPAQ